MLRSIAPFAAEIFAHRELLWQFTLRSVELRHKGSHLGLFWSFLNPLLMLGLYVFVFSGIFGGSFGATPNETKFDYALGLLVGLALFGFVAETIAVSSAAIVGNPNFVKKVVFPLEVLPAANVGAAGVHLGVSIGLILIGTVTLGGGLTWSALWIPVIILPLTLLALGLAWGISAVGVFFRDLGPILQFTTTALMFASAIFYPPSKIPPEAWAVLQFNPLLLAVDLARDALLWHIPIRPLPLVYLYLISTLVCYMGYGAFRKLRPGFADVL